MMNEDNGSQAYSLSLTRDPEFRGEAAQIQAKALLKEVAGELPPYKWNYLLQRIIRNSVLGTLELQSVASRSPERLRGELTEAARRLALVWEYLARLGEGTRKDLALLNAAVNYEIAGYQANAAYLARSLARDLLPNDEQPMLHMSLLFLQRKLLKLRQVTPVALAEPEGDGKWDAGLAEALATALTGSAFTHALRFLLRGERSGLQEAVEDLQRAETVFSSLRLIEETNLVRSVASLLPVIEGRATWTWLPKLAPDRAKWLRYLKLLARGVGGNLLEGSSVSELWPSQITAIEQGLLESISSKVVKMPTSAGKTRIAELAIVHTLVTNREQDAFMWHHTGRSYRS